MKAGLFIICTFRPEDVVVIKLQMQIINKYPLDENNIIQTILINDQDN